jgi:hypothetical protein
MRGDPRFSHPQTATNTAKVATEMALSVRGTRVVNNIGIKSGNQSLA